MENMKGKNYGERVEFHYNNVDYKWASLEC